MAAPSMMWARRLLLAVGALAAAAAPAGAIVMRHDRPDEAFQELGRKFPATVRLRIKVEDRYVGGEGTLIAPRWVLTAAHVVDGLGDSVEAVAGGRTYAVERTVRHPEWKGNPYENTDIALVKLSSPVEDVEPARLYTGEDELGMVVTFAGRGWNGTGLTGPEGRDGKLRGATNTIEEVGPRHIRFRFDAPGDPGVCDLEGISGPGDSGGPAYIERDGVLYVVGVSSYQDQRGGEEGLYGVLEHYPRVSHYAGWIRGVLAGDGAPGQRKAPLPGSGPEEGLWQVKPGLVLDAPGPRPLKAPWVPGRPAR